MAVISTPLSKTPGKLVTCLAIALLVWLAETGSIKASEPIVLDGDFTDWAGEQNITDPIGGSRHEDIVGFWWADNDGESYTFWRVDRRSSKKAVTYIVYVDTNNNGLFSENEDREVAVNYDPLSGASRVDVTIRHADTDATISQITGKDWGESIDQSARYVEFKASFDDLGITANQTVRMYVEGFTFRTARLKDRTPDQGDIQWSPVDIMGYALLSGMMLAGIALVWWFGIRCEWKMR